MPVIPLIVQLLTLGIPAIVQAANKKKGERSAREAAARAANTVAGLATGAGVGAATIDQSGVGNDVMSALTNVPIDALPATAPEWVQALYLLTLGLGISARVAMQFYNRPKI